MGPAGSTGYSVMLIVSLDRISVRAAYSAAAPCRRTSYRYERDLRGVHHAADGIAARRVRSEVLPLRSFRGYTQLGGAGSEQAWRALGAGRAGMDAIDRDPMTAQLDCQRLCHVHHGGIACSAAEIAGVAGVGTADVDDTAPALHLHERDDSAGTA